MTPSLTKERGTKGHNGWGGGGVEVIEQKEIPFSNLYEMVSLLISPAAIEQ